MSNQTQLVPQVKQVSIKHLLGLDVNEAFTTNVNEWPNAPELLNVTSHIEPINPHYVFRRALTRDLLAWRSVATRPILLFGPTQCGKSSVVKQMTARLGIPVWKLTANDETELYQFFGQYTLGENGQSIWVDGPLTQAAKHGGWFLLDEVDRLRPSVAIGLNGVLEAETFTLDAKGGEVIVPHEDFRIVCTANTNLCGDEAGIYNTANIHDKSLLERFDMIIRVDYADPEQERKLLENVLSMASDDELKYWFAEEGIKVEHEAGQQTLEGEYVTRGAFIDGMQKVTAMIRSQSVDGGNQQGNALERTMSTSTLMNWATRMMTFRASTEQGLSAIHYALERVLTNGCTATTKTAIHEIVFSVFNVNPELG